MKKLISTLLLTTASILFADATSCFMDTPVPNNCAYLPPTRSCILCDKNINQSNVYTGVEFLYWEAGLDGLEYAFQNKGTAFHQKGTMHKISGSWEPALRIFLGYHLPHDNWRLDGSFTYFQTTVDHHTQQLFDRASPNGGGLIATWTSPFAFAGNTSSPSGSTPLNIQWIDALAHWDFTANIVDIMLKHSLCIGTQLSIDPGFGLKIATLQNYYKVLYLTGPNTANGDIHSSNVPMKNRSLNIGPEASLASHWTFNSNWSFNALVSGSLLSSRFSVSRNETDIYSYTGVPAATEFIHLNDTYWTFRPQGALHFDLRFGNCLCRQDSVIYYAFSLGYEMQYWWKQNMLLRYVDGEALRAQVAPTQGDLFFQGLTLGAEIDF